MRIWRGVERGVLCVNNIDFGLFGGDEFGVVRGIATFYYYKRFDRSRDLGTQDL